MKVKQVYVCSSCQGQATGWRGQCPRCGEWNTLAPQAAQRRQRNLAASGPAGSGAGLLRDHPDEDREAIAAGMPELDQVLGGGLTPGSAILLGGEPGIGKSTLLLQLAGSLARQGLDVVYCSGEESLTQLKARAKRLNQLDPGPRALATTDADLAIAALISSEPPDLLIVDSIQTLASPHVEGGAGSVAQVRAVSSELIEKVKKTSATLILVGHVTKDGQIAGPKLLEHMVDTVLYLEGERRHVHRILRVLKNRFGPSDELLVLGMHEQGLSIVPDPSTYFLGERDASASGSAVVMAIEGQRPFAVEVQALASRSYLSIPRRTALGFDLNRLHLLVAVLEKRLNVGFGQFDIYTKIGGGLSLKDPGLDLGLIAALLSSFYDQPLPPGAVFWGEVDLNGRIRPASGQEVRLRQALRLGLGPVFMPKIENSEGVENLKDFQAKLFGKAR